VKHHPLSSKHGGSYDGYDEFMRNLDVDEFGSDSDSLGRFYKDDAVTSLDDSSAQQEEPTAPYSTNMQRKTPSSAWDKGRSQATVRKRATARIYRRDPTDDFTIQVDEKKVNQLLLKRSRAQQDRNYVLADDIRDELNDVHGVYVWDRDGLWSCSAIAPRRRYRGNGGKTGQTPAKPSRRQFGRNGHDYVQIGGEIDESMCSLKLHEIHSFLSKRLEYKLLKRYDKADEIQSILYENGVKIHDRLKQWRADGGIFADVEGMVARSYGKPFQLNEYSKSLPDDDRVVRVIEDLVFARDEARASLDYVKADELREILWTRYRVAVDDKSRTFSVGGDFGPNGTFLWTDNGPVNPKGTSRLDKKDVDWRLQGGMYVQSPYSKPLANENMELEEVENLIHDRLEAKRVQDYKLADHIRDFLYQKYGVSVDDRLRQWSVGGLFDEGEIEKLQKESPTSPDGKITSFVYRRYNRRGGIGHLTEQDISQIEIMVQQRAEEMARFNRPGAKAIQNTLWEKYFVVVDDIHGEWYIRGNDYILSPVWEHRLPLKVKESREEIEKLIRERTQARHEKDYGRADEIRNDLISAYNIKLDDRIKEWTIIDDVEGKD
jgi:cysteinyl-tRNA synthetase